MAVPMFAAYGVVYRGGPFFPLIVAATFLPFLIIPTVIGSAITLLLVNIFPARRTRDILSVIAVLAAGGIVVLFRLVRPERLARPEGFRSLVDFITILRDADVADAAERVGAARGDVVADRTDRSAALLPALVDRGGGVRARRAAPPAALRQGIQQGAGERPALGAAGADADAAAHRALAPFGIVRRELVLKEASALLPRHDAVVAAHPARGAGVVYVFNIKFLPLRGEGDDVLPRERRAVPESRARRASCSRRSRRDSSSPA